MCHYVGSFGLLPAAPWVGLAIRIGCARGVGAKASDGPRDVAVTHLGDVPLLQ